MTFEEWLTTVPTEITADALWNMKLYQQALFLGDLAWFDACKLVAPRQTLGISDQLNRAVGSISANIAEGYSKASSKDQARYYEYALGSAREARDWYYKARHVLGDEVAIHRMRLLVQVIRQLLTLVPQYRARRVKEEGGRYVVTATGSLLENAPMSSHQNPD